MIFNLDTSYEKPAGSLTLSAASGTIRYINGKVTFTVTRSGDGAISVRSSNTSVATVVLSGNTVTVTAIGTGSAVITVSVAEGTNHKAPADQTYTVTTQGYLVYAGVPFADITGVGKIPDDGYAAATSVWATQKDGYLEFGASPSGAYGIAYFNTKVDLTLFNKITIEGSLHQDAEEENSLTIWDSIGTYIGQGRVSVCDWNGGDASASKDISALSGSKYIGLVIKSATQQVTSIRLT